MVKKFIKKGVVLVTSLAIMLSCIPAFASEGSTSALAVYNFGTLQAESTTAPKGITNQGKSLMSIVDIDGRRALKVTNATDASTQKTSAIQVWHSNDNAVNAIHVETEFMRDALTNGNLDLNLQQAWANRFGTVRFSNDGKIMLHTSNNNYSATGFTYDVNTWYHVDIWANVAKKTFEVVINGGDLTNLRLCGQLTSSYTTNNPTSIKHVYFWTQNATGAPASVYIDYIYARECNYAGYLKTDSEGASAQVYGFRVEDFNNVTSGESSEPYGMNLLNNATGTASATAVEFDGRSCLKIYDQNSSKPVSAGFTGIGAILADKILVETAFNIARVGEINKRLDIRDQGVVTFRKDGKIVVGKDDSNEYELDTWYTIRAIADLTDGSVEVHISGGKYTDLVLETEIDVVNDKVGGATVYNRIHLGFRDPVSGGVAGAEVEMYVDYLNFRGYDAEDFALLYSTADKNQNVSVNKPVTLVFTKNLDAATSKDKFQILVDGVATTAFTAAVDGNKVTITPDGEGFGAGKYVEIRLNALKSADGKYLYGYPVCYNTVSGDSMGQWRAIIQDNKLEIERNMSCKEDNGDSYVFAVGIYEDNRLVKAEMRSATVDGVKTLRLDLPVETAEALNGKVFLWNAGSLVPVEDVASVSELLAE